MIDVICIRGVWHEPLSDEDPAPASCLSLSHRLLPGGKCLYSRPLEKHPSHTISSLRLLLYTVRSVHQVLSSAQPGDWRTFRWYVSGGELTRKFTV